MLNKTRQGKGKEKKKLPGHAAGFHCCYLKLARATQISYNKVIAPVAERHVKVFILQTQAEQLERASELRKTACCLYGSSQKPLPLPHPFNNTQICRDPNRPE